MSLAPCRVHVSSRLGVVCKVSFEIYAAFISRRIHFMDQNPARRLLCAGLLYKCFARFGGGLGIWKSCRVDLVRSTPYTLEQQLQRRQAELRGQGSLPLLPDPTCPAQWCLALD